MRSNLALLRPVSTCAAGVVLALAASAPAARASSTLNFPKLAFESDTFVGIAIVNPTSQDAAVTLTAYDSDGRQLAGSGFVNPVQVTIKANQQIAKLTSELFGASLGASTVGWVQATSATDNLTGFFLLLDASVTFMDGADLPASSTGLTFQQVRIGSGYSTELDLVNPSSAAATAQLRLFRTGAATISKSISLASKGMARIDAAIFFGVTDVSTASYVDVQSDVEIAGVEFVKGPGGEILALNGRRTSDSLARLVFPQLAVLGDYKTELGVINHGTGSAIVTITAYRPSGALYDTADLRTNPVTRTLPAGGSLREDLEAMFGFRGSGTLVGWVEVKGTDATLGGYLSYGIAATGASAAVTTASQGRTRALFSHIATSGYFTGVAALNPGTLAANVRIVAAKSSGEILGSYDTVLQPGERIAKLLGTPELVPEASNQSGGLIWVKSDVPVYLASIFGSDTVLANIPPQDAPDGYAPDAALARLQMRPPLAVLRPGQAQQFRTEGATGALAWKVNGVAGGQSSSGTITPTGLFTAPAAIPSRQVVTVSAEASRQSAGGSVDLVDRSVVAGDLRAVQSVAYLQGLRKLYAAEFAASAAASVPDALAVEAGNSQIVEVSAAGAKTVLGTFNGEKIAKLVPFRALNGREYLLASGQTTGRILRFDPSTRQSRDVVTKLAEPSALVFDPASGDLLVAEKDRITTVVRSVLESDLAPAAARPVGFPERLPASIPANAAAGLAVDRCTGKLYFTTAADGLLLEYDKASGKTRTVLSGLRSPGALLGLYRAGVTCPDGFQLLVAEKGLDRTLLVLPKDGTFVEWVAAKGVNDLTLLPEDNALTSRAGVVFGEASAAVGSISVVAVANLYDSKPPNPPPPPPANPNDADVAISVTAAPNPVAAGGSLTFTITITNKGPATATNVLLFGNVEDDLLQGPETVTITGIGTCDLNAGAGPLCRFPSIAPNGNVVVTISTFVSARPSSNLMIGIGTVRADQNDPDFSNNSATVRISITSAQAADPDGLEEPRPSAVLCVPAAEQSRPASVEASISRVPYRALELEPSMNLPVSFPETRLSGRRSRDSTRSKP